MTTVIFVVLHEYWYEQAMLIGTFRTREAAVRAISVEIEDTDYKLTTKGCWDSDLAQASFNIYESELEG